MDERQALIAFGAMSQETRLRIVRRLVKAGPDGMAARLDRRSGRCRGLQRLLPPEGTQRAGLVAARRDSRSIVYSAEYPALSGLIRFLMDDCCEGNPAICAPVLIPACCVAGAEEATSKTPDQA